MFREISEIRVSALRGRSDIGPSPPRVTTNSVITSGRTMTRRYQIETSMTKRRLDVSEIPMLIPIAIRNEPLRVNYPPSTLRPPPRFNFV